MIGAAICSAMAMALFICTLNAIAHDDAGGAVFCTLLTVCFVLGALKCGGVL